MADQFNDSIPAAANTILADIADMAETFGWLKDCFQHICNGFSNTVLTSLGHVRHLWISSDFMVGNTTNGSTWTEIEYATNDVQKFFQLFGTSTQQSACFDIVMPPGWNRGTIKAKFYWSCNTTGGSAGDTVEWGIMAMALSNHDAIDQAYGDEVTVSDALTADNGADLQISDATAAITIGGTPALGDLIQFKVRRNIDGADNLAVGARLFGVLLEITETFPDASGTNAIATW